MPQVRVYLSRYDTYELPTISNPYTIWLDDMYETNTKQGTSDITSKYQTEDLSEEEIQEEINKLLFL